MTAMIDIDARIERINTLTAALLAANPQLNLTAHILATDQVSAELMTAEVKAGRMTPEQAVSWVGSFARLEWAMRHCPVEWVIGHLPELWMCSDPDDTNPAFLALWQAAFERNLWRIVCDGKRFEPGPAVRAYRGQLPAEPLGIAWTLDRKIAQRFARGAGVRRPIDGVIYQAEINREFVLAYLTGRGESELIIDLSLAEIERAEAA
jgi:hypothetical protein